MIYDYNTLNNAVSTFLIDVEKYDYNAFILFNQMRLSGARFNDITDIKRWNVSDDGIFFLQPQKNNNVRIIQPDQLDDVYMQWILNGLNISNIRSYSTMKRIFYKFFPIYPIIYKQKRINTHLFRHLFAKKLHLNKITDKEIQTILGEKYLSSAKNYIYSELSDMYFSD